MKFLKNNWWLLLIGAIIILFPSCTENQKAKEFGGTAKLELPINEKLINVTWKNEDLWYLTRPMLLSDSAVTYEFREESSYGVWEGNYIIYEKKQ